MSDESALTLKDAIAIAAAKERDAERVLASFARLKEVLTKANEIGNVAHEYDKKRQDLEELSRQYEVRKGEIEESTRQDNVKREQDIHRLDFQIREREAKLKRLQERIAKLTSTVEMLEDTGDANG